MNPSSPPAFGSKLKFMAIKHTRCSKVASQMLTFGCGPLPAAPSLWKAQAFEVMTSHVGKLHWGATFVICFCFVFLYVTLLSLFYCVMSWSNCVFLSGMLNFCANNYLGLSSHPEVVQAGIDALKSHGAGLSSVRFICGTQVWRLISGSSLTCHYKFPALTVIFLKDLHKHLEQKLAEFHEREDCILYASCFDANAGLFEVWPSEIWSPTWIIWGWPS